MITEELVQRVQTLSPEELAQLRYKDKSLHKAIYNATSFLPTNCRIKQRAWHILHKRVDVPTCTVCHAKFVTWNTSSNEYRAFCSSKCSHSTEEVKQRLSANKPPLDANIILQRINNKHGTTFTTITEAYASGIYDDSKAQRLESYYDGKKRGFHSMVKAPLTTEQLEEASIKRKNTNLKRYGVEHPMQLERIAIDSAKKRAVNAKELWLQRNEEMHPNAWDDLRNADLLEELNQTKTLKEIGDLYGYSQHYMSQLFAKYNIQPKRHFHSTFERRLTDWLESLNVDYVANDRELLKGQELDIVIPEAKIAIEVDGTWWHSEHNGKKGRMYHLDKTRKCTDEGYRLLHFWHFEVEYKFDIIQSMILARLGRIPNKIHARQCKVVKVKAKQAREFFLTNHLAGHVNSKEYIGLEHDGILLQLASFSKPRFSRDIEWELVRLATKLNHVVVGGTSKILSAFRAQHEPESLVSYGDRRYSEGNVYNQLGMEETSASEPNSWYFHKSNPNLLMHRINFQKHKLADLLPEYNPDLTAWENLIINGYDRVWDCGNHVFKKRFV